MVLRGDVLGVCEASEEIISTRLKMELPIKHLICHTQRRFILSDVMTLIVVYGEGDKQCYRVLRNRKTIQRVMKHTGYILEQCEFSVKRGITILHAKTLSVGKRIRKAV